MDAPLERDGGGEENDRPKPGEGIDERFGTPARQVLCDFQGQYKIEPSIHGKRLLEVEYLESLLRNLQLLLVRPTGVHADEVLNPEFAEGRQPAPHAAADVNDGPGLNQLQEQRQRFLSGPARAVQKVFRKIGFTGLHAYIPCSSRLVIAPGGDVPNEFG